MHISFSFSVSCRLCFVQSISLFGCLEKEEKKVKTELNDLWSFFFSSSSFKKMNTHACTRNPAKAQKTHAHTYTSVTHVKGND